MVSFYGLEIYVVALAQYPLRNWTN